MNLSREKINILLAKKCWSVTDLASRYGVSRARMNVILNSKRVTPLCSGRIAKALGVDVTEIIEAE